MVQRELWSCLILESCMHTWNGCGVRKYARLRKRPRRSEHRECCILHVLVRPRCNEIGEQFRIEFEPDAAPDGGAAPNAAPNATSNGDEIGEQFRIEFEPDAAPDAAPNAAPNATSNGGAETWLPRTHLIKGSRYVF